MNTKNNDGNYVNNRLAIIEKNECSTNKKERDWQRLPLPIDR
ncbi:MULTISPECIES: hypothetical protein [Providencia]|nr:MULTISPECIES: hypothetical protein [Providencia]MDK7735149.1 hypothetical protein [Providencia stuartii]MDN0006316.1 hypothetical protein [Providencia stuartii]MDN0019246.1 hypothetical protein [Providencia stuartii]MDT7049464.1 hypothetical protein [Providencia stuartii]